MADTLIVGVRKIGSARLLTGALAAFAAVLVGFVGTGCGAGATGGDHGSNQPSLARTAVAEGPAVATRTLPEVKLTSAARRVDPKVKRAVLSLLTAELAHYERDFKHGVWTDPANPGCWACSDGGPMTGAAAAYVLGGAHDKRLLREAVESANTAIATVQHKDGSFADPANDGESVPISTAFYGTQLGMTDYLLRPYLSQQTRRRWAGALTAATMFLVHDGSTVWYANGNINLAYAELAWTAWNATGSAALKRVFNDTWNFAVSPPSGRWPGFGLIVTQAPTLADGSNGSGYFTESDGSDAPGWDPYYTTLQLDVLAPLYAMSHDTRVLRAMNLTFNQERARVNTKTWIVNCAHGSRHTGAVDNEAFQSSSLAVLSLLGGRGELLGYVLPELAAERTWYFTRYTANGQTEEQSDSLLYRRAFGSDIATIALAAEIAQSSARRK